MSLMAMSCSTVFDDDTIIDGENYITLNFKTPGVETRGEVADNEFESFLSHLDVVIYEYNNTTDTYTPFHYERIAVSATPTGKATIAKTKKDFKENIAYRFFVIANSTLDSLFWTELGAKLMLSTGNANKIRAHIGNPSKSAAEEHIEKSAFCFPA